MEHCLHPSFSLSALKESGQRPVTQHFASLLPQGRPLIELILEHIPLPHRISKEALLSLSLVMKLDKWWLER